MIWEHKGDDWPQMKGRLKTRWSKLTDDDLEAIAGQRELLVRRLRDLYDTTTERAEAELRDWERHQEPLVPAGPASSA